MIESGHWIESNTVIDLSFLSKFDALFSKIIPLDFSADCRLEWAVSFDYVNSLCRVRDLFLFIYVRVYVCERGRSCERRKKKFNEEFWLEILFGSIASISSVDHMRHISIRHTTLRHAHKIQCDQTVMDLYWICWSYTNTDDTMIHSS